MIRSIVDHVVNSPVLFFGAFSLFRACLWVAVEHLWRARSVPYRQVATKDFAAEIFHVFLVIPVVLYLYDRLFSYRSFPQTIQNLPMLLRIALYLLIADFGYYWPIDSCTLGFYGELISGITLQRICIGWRLSATIPQQFLVGVPYVLVTPILYSSPWWVYTALVIFDYLAVDWMHLNVSWGAKWLEWFIVTPRYHQEAPARGLACLTCRRCRPLPNH